MNPRSLSRVAILGAESTGKSTLAAALAARYDTIWVPEYLREFVDAHGRVPQEQEQYFIAATQRDREFHACRRAASYLFCDTTPMMTALYSRFYFGRADTQLESLAQAHRYDFTIVTALDTPWVPDGLQRESAEVRLAIHEELLAALASQRIDYLLVAGSLDERVEQVASYLPAPL